MHALKLPGMEPSLPPAIRTDATKAGSMPSLPKEYTGAVTLGSGRHNPKNHSLDFQPQSNVLSREVVRIGSQRENESRSISISEDKYSEILENIIKPGFTRICQADNYHVLNEEEKKIFQELSRALIQVGDAGCERAQQCLKALYCEDHQAIVDVCKEWIGEGFLLNGFPGQSLECLWDGVKGVLCQIQENESIIKALGLSLKLLGDPYGALYQRLEDLFAVLTPTEEDSNHRVKAALWMLEFCLKYDADVYYDINDNIRLHTIRFFSQCINCQIVKTCLAILVLFGRGSLFCATMDEDGNSFSECIPVMSQEDVSLLSAVLEMSGFPLFEDIHNCIQSGKLRQDRRYIAFIKQTAGMIDKYGDEWEWIGLAKPAMDKPAF